MSGGAEGNEDTAGPGAETVKLLAHDIRSAVSDVIGGLRLLDRDSLPADAGAQIDRVHAASELLARLVEELLGGANGETAAEVGNLNLGRFLDDEVRRWHGAAQETGTKVTLDRAADLPAVVRLQLLPLRRIIANLMSNALRHAGGGQVVLGADTYSDGTLSLCVTDNGPGFPEDLLPHIFGPATRGSDSMPGTGMGLHIAAAHAEMLGGVLRVRNIEDGGARATLKFPREVWERPDCPGGGLPDLAGTRVLVADDSATNRTLVQGMLSRMGAECETAVDGIEALNWLARERFDLALIDIEMPVLNGIEVLRSERLRQARGIAPPMSMVAMTAYGARDNRDAIIEAGADGILPKPLGSAEAFGSAVRHFIDAGPKASEWVPERAAVISAAMLADLMSAAGPEFEGQLLDRLREDLAMVEAGLAGGIARGDWAEVMSQTHILLSLATAVGALPTEAAARRLQLLGPDAPPEALRSAGRICLARLGRLRAELCGAG